MRPRDLSSGDLVADRRAAYAAGLAEAGDFAAAAELIEQALELVPQWAGGWSLLAGYRERAGDIEAACSAWRSLSALDPAGIFGAVLKLAAYGAAAVVPTTDTAFVAALFDDYAGRFEQQLLGRLQYAVPQLLTELLLAAMSRRSIGQFAHAIDLGCGTGLMGERLRQHVSYIEGVDLSGGMVAQSTRKGIYDSLAQAELSAYLAGHEGGADLLVAADVLNYCGALAPVLAAAAQALVPGGFFAFSLEAHTGAEAVVLRPSLRYAHEQRAARTALTDAGFEIVSFEPSVLRVDAGVPVAGYLVLAALPKLAARPEVVDEAGPFIAQGAPLD